MPTLAASFSEAICEHEIAAEINHLSASKTIVDHDYWWRTIDRVEEGRDPHGNAPLTRTALNAWVARCQTRPEDHDHANHPRGQAAPKRGVRHVTPK